MTDSGSFHSTLFGRFVRLSRSSFGLALSLAAILLMPLACRAVDLNQVERDLEGKGVQGWIHGSVKDRGLYVFTYRNPNDFFDAVEMSLVSDSTDLTAQLAALNRHDKVLVKGSFLENPSPQKHIQLASIQLIKKFTSAYPVDEHQYEAKVPDDLLNLERAEFLVHAIAEDGHILVVEFKDQVLPIFVKNADLAKDLYRNDLVNLSFHIQHKPKEPTHLVINENESDAVKVIEAIRDRHGKQVTVEGALILFPKSPEIIFNVFAVQDESHPSNKRQYTLLNPDPAIFTKIRDVLQKAWDRHPGAYVNGRNKLVSQAIRVRVSGTFNEINPGQANAQVFLDSPDVIQIIDSQAQSSTQPSR